MLFVSDLCPIAQLSQNVCLTAQLSLIVCPVVQVSLNVCVIAHFSMIVCPISQMSVFITAYSVGRLPLDSHVRVLSCFPAGIAAGIVSQLVMGFLFNWFYIARNFST